MSTVLSGVVSNGCVIPESPLAEGLCVQIHVVTENPELNTPSPGRMTISELMKLPREERRAILAASAALAEEIYRTDKDLTGFDAFSEELDDESE